MLRFFSFLLVLCIAACGTADGEPTHPETASVAETNTNLLTIERLYAAPSLSGPSPRGVKFSPDGSRVTFLKARADEGNRWDLWQFDVATGEPSMLVDSKILEPDEVELSEEEKALRERKRIAGSKGIVSYDWGTADTILVPIGGDLHLVTLTNSGKTGENRGFTGTFDLDESVLNNLGITKNDVTKQVTHSLSYDHDASAAEIQAALEAAEIELPDGRKVPLKDLIRTARADGQTAVSRQLTDTDAFEYDAKVSPSGKYVSFVRDGAVYAIELATGEETRLTPLAEPGNAISYGVAEFVAQEEMDRYTGYWWSPDDRYIAYTRVDESTVDIIPRFDIAAEDVTVIEQRYPRAGRPNAIVDLFVKNIKTGEITEIDWRRDDWGPATDQYLARVNWLNSSLLVQVVDRDQKNLVRLAAHEKTREVSEVAREVQAQWINLSNDFRSTPEGVYGSSESSGFRHIVFTPDESDDERHITSGNWPIDAFLFSHSSGDDLVFTGYKDTPLERHLYTYGTWHDSHGEEPTRITELGKSWSITMSPDGKSFVGTSSAPDQPPQTGLYQADGTLITWIEENALDETHPYAPFLDNHTVPEYGTLKAENGMDLYYSIQKPPGFDPAKKYPVLVNVYGGPGAQTVTRNWERMTDQFYTHQGYIVFRLDNRGTANRGKAFEDEIYRRTGYKEVHDQLVGVEWLKNQPFVDADNIAIQGWSYGGYMTLMTILQAPEGTFAAAFAGAPVTDWSLYDTFYTERYMNTPQDNPDGYEKSSVFFHLDKLEHELPPLMLVHGMADDNVTFDNTTRLMAELQQKGILFELMTYPGQRHGIRGQKLSTHLMKTRMAFLDRHLKSE